MTEGEARDFVKFFDDVVWPKVKEGCGYGKALVLHAAMLELAKEEKNFLKNPSSLLPNRK